MGIQEIFVKLKEYTCERCRHVWRQRVSGTDDPLTCAKCRSAYWNRPRRNRVNTTETESAPHDAQARNTSVLTISAQELLHRVDDGGIPLYITDSLRQIAAENGLEVSDRGTPNSIIEALRALDK